jgi:ABC-2 type transport system ATP-binding protein
LKLAYTGTTPPGVRPTRVFAQLVDDTTGLVLGNQITPIEVTLDGKRHHTSVPLEDIAFTARAGAHVTLQMVAATTAYAKPRLGGSITFDSIDVSLPVASGLKAG